MYIRKFGEERPFLQRRHIYFVLDSMKYWTMGEPIDEVEVINRTLEDGK
jgi:hypothetical protein